jgi:hypothetical protein
MIDYKTYRRFHPKAEMFQFSKHSIAPFDRWPEHIPHNAILENKLLILLPPFIHGFFLKDKKWGKQVKLAQFKECIANLI